MTTILVFLASSVYIHFIQVHSSANFKHYLSTFTCSRINCTEELYTHTCRYRDKFVFILFILCIWPQRPSAPKQATRPMCIYSHYNSATSFFCIAYNWYKRIVSIKIQHRLSSNTPHDSSSSGVSVTKPCAWFWCPSCVKCVDRRISDSYLVHPCQQSVLFLYEVVYTSFPSSPYIFDGLTSMKFG